MSRARDSWFKFEMDAWLEDTRHMTLEQRGAYIDAIVLQMKYARPLSDDMKWLSHALHISERKARAIFEGLIELGVVQRTEDGLTNKRAEFELGSRLAQRRAKAESALARERAKREKLEKANENNDDPTTEKHNNRVRVRVREDISNKTLGQNWLFDRVKTSENPSETGAQQPEVKSGQRAKPRPRPTDEQFTAFWDAYPRRVKKSEARKRFLLLSPDDADLAIQGAQAYARTVAQEARDPTKILHPTTYLNQRVFEDVNDSQSPFVEPDPVNGKVWGFWRTDPAWAKPFSASSWRSALDRAQPNGTWPWWSLGPPPGHPECLVHPDVVAERGLRDVYRGKIVHD